MRGKEYLPAISLDTCRITPAYAGKSIAIPLAVCLAQGSPPPMRGKVFNGIGEFFSGRITPAYAGKSLCSCFHA